MQDSADWDSVHMTKKQWTLPLQCAWLDSQIPIYLLAKESKATSNFFAETWSTWKKKWPVAHPTPEDLAKVNNDEDAAVLAKEKELKAVGFYSIAYS